MCVALTKHLYLCIIQHLDVWIVRNVQENAVGPFPKRETYFHVRYFGRLGRLDRVGMALSVRSRQTKGPGWHVQVVDGGCH